MTQKIIRLLAILLIAHAPIAHAQVPQIINYQGRIAVDTAVFNGNGQFKFALVNTDGSTSYWSNDQTSTAGSQPATAVTLPVTKGLYSVLLGDASLANMTPVPANVFINNDVRLRIWFNDGTKGFQLLSPDQRIAAVGYAFTASTVADGSITAAKLAGNAVASSAILNSSVTNAKLSTPFVTINTGNGLAGGGTVPLGGNITLTSTGGGVTSLSGGGGVTVSGGTGAVTLGSTATSANTPGAIVARDANGNFSAGTVNGTFVGNGAGLTGITVPPGAITGTNWSAIPATGAPSKRSYATAVWSGSEVIVWGGWTNPAVYGDGGRFNPSTGAWTQTSSSGSPAARYLHSALWTGSKMIIWGGANSGNVAFGDGGLFDPASNSWTNVASAGAPAARYGHAAVWTGTEMIVWGGYSTAALSSGGRYNPATDTWTPMSTTGAPAARSNAAAVWTGTEMIIWGGTNGSTLNSGARYNPSTDTWTTISTTGAPAPNTDAVAVWTGTEMIVYGGYSAPYRTGGRYNPATNTWTLLPTSGAPAGSGYISGVWNGTSFIVWGGAPDNGTSSLNTGAVFSPATNTWTALLQTGAPAARSNHSAVWTGSEMIVWGGGATNQLADMFNDGARYSTSKIATGAIGSNELAASVTPKFDRQFFTYQPALIIPYGINIGNTKVTTINLGENANYLINFRATVSLASGTATFVLYNGNNIVTGSTVTIAGPVTMSTVSLSCIIPNVVPGTVLWVRFSNLASSNVTLSVSEIQFTVDGVPVSQVR